MCEDGPIRLEHQASIGTRTDAGLRLHVGDGLLSPMSRKQGQPGGHTLPLWGACAGGRARVRFQAPRA
jgi:hypothetical protein